MCVRERERERVNRKKFDFKDDLKDVSVFDDLTLQGRLFKTDDAA